MSTANEQNQQPLPHLPEPHLPKRSPKLTDEQQVAQFAGRTWKINGEELSYEQARHRKVMAQALISALFKDACCGATRDRHVLICNARYAKLVELYQKLQESQHGES